MDVDIEKPIERIKKGKASDSTFRWGGGFRNRRRGGGGGGGGGYSPGRHGHIQMFQQRRARVACLDNVVG